MKLIIKNCQLVNGKKVNVLINGGRIAKITDKEIAEPRAEVIEAEGLTLLPAFVDMHTHLREPGLEYKEDITSGSKAAVAGGFASIACMPNTLPPADNAATIGYIKQRGIEENRAKIYPIGAITKGQSGQELAEIGKMKEAGAVAISDDGKPVESANLMRHALEYAGDFDIPVLSHCEEKTLSESGYVNEGYFSMLTGLKGISRASEEIAVAREILLAETLNRPVHICHVSTKGSVRMVREAKKRGVKVTCETCPHYFSATDELIQDFNPDTKVNPPLREEDDRLAVIEGLIDGAIDAIATDHAPHHKDEKNIEYALAAFGISGLETSFALSYTYLVRKGYLTLEKLSKLMTKNPAEILKIPCGEIKKGGLADLVLVNTKENWTIDSARFFSKGKNTPFDGWEVLGKVKATIVDGEIKYLDGRII